MMPELESLVKLQQVDARIYELMQAQKDYPQTIATLESTVQQASAIVVSERKKLDALQTEKKITEDKITEAKTQLDHTQELLNGIKTNREYDAVHAQIENFKHIVSGGDSKLKSIAVNIESVTASVTSAEAELEKIKLENEPKMSDINIKMGTINESVAKETAQRNQVLSTISKTLLRTYEYILKRRKNGQVLSFVGNSAKTCSVCHKILEPQLINEIRKSAKMLTCQNCGSIFVWKSDEQAA
jgi:predicted  nucleic acid-binding Zn-ribbon protein